jgi:hypothetical protein
MAAHERRQHVRVAAVAHGLGGGSAQASTAVADRPLLLIAQLIMIIGQLGDQMTM